MRALLFKYWDRIRGSFWFIPALMAGTATALALASVSVSARLAAWLGTSFGWEFDGGAEGASAVLGIVAGSMITIAGVVFSMTLVVLSLTSSQMGPRLLRSFMRDTATQVVLGTYIATFVYCLLVLRTIRRAEEIAFVPHVAVSLGVVLAVASVAVLIYFVHHVAVSIQANEVAARLGGELIAGIERHFPEREATAPLQAPAAMFGEEKAIESVPLDATADGYLQFVDRGTLVALAAREDLVIRLLCKPGNYLVAGRPLAQLWPASRVSEELAAQCRACLIQGNQRSADQDVEFSINQLVEIAVRALSPGVNDPFTAMTCVDRLGSALSRLARRGAPPTCHYDDENRLRLVLPVDTFADLADAAFNQIRQYGRTSAAVSIRLLETLAVVAGFAWRSEDRAALLHHAGLVAREATAALAGTHECGRLEECRREVARVCGAEA